MKRFLKLDSIVLFALLIPFIMNYRIGPGNTPYWLFGILFFLLFFYIILDIKIFKISDYKYALIKKVILWFTIIISIGSGLFSEIIVRHESSPIYHVHDIILQQEAAVRFLLHGVNPYATSYLATPMAQWHYSDTEINPALFHFVMQPFYLIFALPFYLAMGHSIGFFDARIPLFVLFIVLLVAAWKVAEKEDDKRLFITLLALNPATLGYFIEGRDDIFMYSFLFVGLLLLQRGKYISSSIAIALAFAVKQSVWPLFPFYAAYIYFKTKNKSIFLKSLLFFTATFLIIVAPFFLWNQKAFLDSTIFYLSGNVSHSYPIAGYGLGMLLYQLGFIKDLHAYYPFWIWEAVFSLPILVFLLIWLKNKASVQRMIICYGIFLFIFWYCNRYFHNSHLGYLSMVFITAYFWPED